MLLANKIKDFHIILGSQSPRRQDLLAGVLSSELNVHHPFEVVVKDVNEIFPEDMPVTEVPCYLAELKAKAFTPAEIKKNTIVITADTIVLLNGKIMGKPTSAQDAVAMLKSLSGNRHEVITGVCLRSAGKTQVFSDRSEVWFRHLSLKEIRFYTEHFRPFDKAGAYGVQEWIGYIGIEKIEGSYFNVMGLPTQQLYIELMKFIS